MPEGPQPSLGPCVGDEVLAAYFDGRLMDPERAAVTAHLSDCGDCVAVLTEVIRASNAVRAAERDRAAARAARPRRALIGGGVVLAIAASAILAIRINRPTPVDYVAELVIAAGNDRTVVGRLTGGFQHGPLRSPSRAGIPTTESGLALLAAAGRAQAAAQLTSDAKTLHAYGVAVLLLGNHDSAIANLQAAVDLDPEQPALLNDLAVAFAERAVRANRASDYPRALEFSQRALQLEPDHEEALFTRAAALEWMGLHERAIEGWNEYLRADSASGWADEARSRITGLQQPAPRVRWKDLDRLLGATASSEADLLQMSRDVPDRLPEVLLSTVLGRWTTSRDPGALTLAVQLSEALAIATGDDSLRRACGGLTAPGSNPATIAAIESLSKGYRLLARDRYVDAEPHLTSAVAGLTRAPLLRSWAAFGLGRVRYFRGAAVQAERDFEEVIAAARLQRAGALEARALWLRGIVRFTQGRWALARLDYEDAIRAYSALRDFQGVATVHVNLSILFRFLGDSESVWQHRMVALNRIPAHQPTLAHGFLITTAVTASLENMDRVALLFLDEAVKNASADIPAYTRAETLLQRGKALARVGRRAEAENDLTAAETAWRDISDATVQQRVRMSLLTAAAQIHYDTNPDAAVREAGEALDNATERGDLLRSAELHLYLGRALARNATVSEARRTIEAGIADFHKARASMPATDPIRLSAFEPVWELFDEAFTLALGTGAFDRPAAFEKYESSRAQTLLELRSQESSAFPVVQSQLSDRQTMVLLHQQPKELLAWVITRNGDRLLRLKLTGVEAQRLAARFFWRLAAGTELDAISKEVYAAVLSPILESVPPGHSVIIVPDKPFASMPWAALIDPATGDPAVTRWSISVSPSASLAVSSRASRTGLSGWRALVVSAADVQSGLPLLNGARDEARQIASIYADGGELLEGHNATAGNVLERLPSKDVVHVSAHAISNAAYPLLSRLVLSGDPTDLDGLSVRELLDAGRLSPGTLVVLAACRTLGATTIRGEGAIGIAWGFLAAGASTVVATLWDVDDAAVAPVFVDFHRRLIAGTPPAEALRAAQLAALGRGESERTWGSLQLVGLP